MIATLAVHDNKAADETFLEVLPIIEAAADDDRNFVKKAVNWALRQIGKRNTELRIAAIEVAKRLGERPEAAARWVGRTLCASLVCHRIYDVVHAHPVRHRSEFLRVRRVV